MKARGFSVTLIESPDIRIIGVGEGTWPTMRSTLEKMGVSETDFFRKCDAAFKQGGKFTGWTTGAADDAYYHPLMFPQGFTQLNLVPHWMRGGRGRSPHRDGADGPERGVGIDRHGDDQHQIVVHGRAARRRRADLAGAEHRAVLVDDGDHGAEAAPAGRLHAALHRDGRAGGRDEDLSPQPLLDLERQGARPDARLGPREPHPGQ